MKRICLVGFIAIFAVGCGYKSPVLYPNNAYNRMGSSAAESHVDMCEAKAEKAGIEKSKALKEAAKRGAIGAGVGAAAGAASTAIYGGKVGRGTAAGAVGGGIWGSLTSLFRADEPNPTYKNYVNRCVREKGLDVIGWE